MSNFILILRNKIFRYVLWKLYDWSHLNDKNFNSVYEYDNKQKSFHTEIQIAYLKENNYSHVNCFECAE